MNSPENDFTAHHDEPPELVLSDNKWEDDGNNWRNEDISNDEDDNNHNDGDANNNDDMDDENHLAMVAPAPKAKI